MKKRFLIFSLSAALLLVFCSDSPVFADWLQSWEFGYFPENVNSANYGHEVDRLYRVIFFIVTVVFFATELMLLFCCVVFRNRPKSKAFYSHGSTKAEIGWSIAPAGILVWLALTQNEAWRMAKMDYPDESNPEVVTVQVFGEQFQWNFRYPGTDGVFATEDDVVTVNQLYVPVDTAVLLKMSTKDVIHSLFLPNARVKQDVVPGMMTKAWFKIGKLAVYDIADAENQNLKFVPPEEFANLKVSWGGHTFVEEKVDQNGKMFDAERDKTELWKGYKKYYYKPNADLADGATGMAKGQITEFPPSQATHVMHYFDLACAELCGLGHYKMKAQLHVVTREMYEKVLSAQGKSMAAQKFTNIWDEYFPHYNEVKSKAH